MKLKFVYGFQKSETIIVKTNDKYLSKIQDFIGHSILRVKADDSETSLFPLPLGTFFIGNSSFGYWSHSNSGDKFWKFFRAHDKLKSVLNISDKHYFFKNYTKSLIYQNNPALYLNEFKARIKKSFKTKHSIYQFPTSKMIKEQFSYLWTFPKWNRNLKRKNERNI